MQNARLEIEKILKEIKDTNWWTRKSLIEKLLAFPENLYLETLEAWLRRGDDAFLRNAAMEAYRALGEKAIKALVPLLRDKDTDAKIFAANILGDIKDFKAVPYLIAALSDEDTNVKSAAAEALGKIGDKDSIDALEKALNDDPWMAMACIEALGEIGGSKALSILQRYLEHEEYGPMAFSAIEKAGDKHFIQDLIPFINKDSTREAALKALVAIAEREKVKPLPSYFNLIISILIDLQNSSNAEIKRSAFIALSWAEDIRGLPQLINGLNDDDLREYAINGLIALGKKSVPFILEALKKPDSNKTLLTKVLTMLGEGNIALKFADQDKNVFMSEEEFDLLRSLINKEFGIQIKGDKRLTLHTKISHRLQMLDINSYRAYYNYLITDSSREELYSLISHITNNETYFFREKPQLDVFTELLNEVKKERQKKEQKQVKILSLASSSGEEAYSLNILAQESGLFLWDWDIKIIGIDIDRNAINKAQAACYNKNSLRFNGNLSGNTIDFLNKYFVTDGENFFLKKAFSKNVSFRHGNLLDSKSFADFKDIDIIFCRNVLMYMDDNAIKKIVANLYSSLSDTGYLFIGSTESLIQKTDLFYPEYCKGVIVYKKAKSMQMEHVKN